MDTGTITATPDASATASEQTIKEGACFHNDICFDSQWCMDYLKLSGDKNLTLHSTSGKGIVQGMAIMTKMGAFVSEIIPNYMVVEIGGGDALKFKKPIYVDESVTMAIKIIQVGRIRVIAEFTLLRDEVDILMQMPISLVHMRMLDRAK